METSRIVEKVIDLPLSINHRRSSIPDILYNRRWIGTLSRRDIGSGPQNELYSGWDKNNTSAYELERMRCTMKKMKNKYNKNKKKRKAHKRNCDKNNKNVIKTRQEKKNTTTTNKKGRRNKIKGKRTNHVNKIKQSKKNSKQNKVKKGKQSKKKRTNTNRKKRERTKNRKQLINKNRLLNIGTWNINSMVADRVSHLLTQEMKDVNCDIIGLQEVRRKNTGQIDEVTSGYRIFWSGNEKGQNYGVGIAIRLSILDSLKEFQFTPYNDRMLHCRLKFHKQKRAIHFIVLYRRPESKKKEDKMKDEMDNKIIKLVNSIPNNDSIFVLGDFNARTGSEREGIEHILGPYGLDERNDNGQRLINLCVSTNLTIANTWHHKTSSQNTFWDKRTKVPRRLDYILMKQRDRPKMIDCDTHVMGYMSDHAMPMATVNTRFCRGKKKKEQKVEKKKKINRRQLKKNSNSELLTSMVDDKIQKYRAQEGELITIDSEVEALTNIIYEASLEVLGEEKKEKEIDWLSEHTDIIDKLRKQHKKAYQKYKKVSKTHGIVNCTELLTIAKNKQKELKKLMKYISNKQMNRDVLWKIDLLKDKDPDDLSDFYRLINVLPIDITRTDNVQPVMNKRGEVVHTVQEILETFEEHFIGVFAGEGRSKAHVNITDRLLQYGVDKSLGLTPTIGEVEDALKFLKNRKATGEDMIFVEILKSFDTKTETKKFMFNIICKCWEEGDVPQSWKDAIIMILFKKGDKTNCNNYRGISLMSHMGKILAKIIAKRLQDYVEAVGILPEEQTGFRDNRACIDQIYVLRRVQEMCIELNIPLYICFVDLTKAYDSIDRKTLWKILKKCGVDEKMIKIIRAFHDNMKAKINISGNFSNELDINEGLRQGCVMATILFNIFFGVIFHEMKRKIKLKNDSNVGIKIETKFHVNPANEKFREFFKNGEGTIEEWKAFAMFFADDAAFVATSEEELQLITEIFDETCKEFGLTVSIPKTKIMVQWDKKTIKKQETPPTTIVTLGSNTLEEVDHFKYLGVIISNNGSWSKEFQHRKGKAWFQFLERRKTIFQRYLFPLTHKIWLFKVYVLTTLLYGCEAWAPTAEEFTNIETIQRKMLMMILNIRDSDKVNYVNILEKTKMLCVESYIRKQRLIWAGKIARMGDDRVPKLMFFGEVVGGHSSRGARKHTLRDAVYQDLVYFNINKSKWIELAEQGQSSWIEIVNEGREHFINNWKMRKPEKKAREFFRDLPMDPANKKWQEAGKKYVETHPQYNYFIELNKQYKLQYPEVETS